MAQDDLVVTVLSDDAADAPALAEQFKRQLSDAGSVRLSAQKAPDLPGRGFDPAATMEVIQLTVAALGAVTAVAQALNCFKTERPAVQIVIANPGTGQSVRISGADSVGAIQKKLNGVTGKPGLIRRLFKRS